jgi:ethanolamine ammonia-lyase small subunit
MKPDQWTQLRDLTAARIALGRAGHSVPTRELLDFQLAHARARDAVHHAFDPRSFEGIRLHSAARDRATYLRRPDLGRRLNAASAAMLTRGDWDAVVVVADGLSAAAAHRQAPIVVDTLFRELQSWKLAPLCIVEQGRVAIGDEIGERLEARLAVVLIGERPGLSSPDSLGAYLTWAPRIGRTDAERNCVSNIRPEGLDPRLAAMRVAELMRAARDRQITSVEKKSPAISDGADST